MADSAVADPPPPSPPPQQTTSSTSNDDFNGLPIPPLDPNFFNQDIQFSDHHDAAFNFNQDDNNDVGLVDLDFDLDFSFDDLLMEHQQPPLPDPAFFDSDCFVLPGSDPNLTQLVPDRRFMNALKSTSPEFPHFSGGAEISNSSSSPEPEVYQVSGDQSLERNQISGQDVSGYLNFPSPESNGSKGSNDSRVLNCPSPDSGNCGSDVSEESNKSVSSSRSKVSAQKIKFEELKDVSNNSHALLKRKKESDDSNVSISRTNKYQKSSNGNYNLTDNIDSSNNGGVLSEEEEKRRARLMRNRESAQLSRQRKKHYVDELEDKVKNMGSTIQQLNAQIAYISHENARLRQQMGGGMAPPPAAVPMGAAPPPPPGMGMYPPMMYPWMPCGVQPYMVKPQGSQVPLVPIPRLKSQQPLPAPKVNKKAESKKSEKSEAKTKKVASVSFLGLMFFIMLFGGLVPMVNVRYGGVREAFGGGSGYMGSQFYEKHRGRVLAVDGNVNRTNYDKYSGGSDFVKHKNHCYGGCRDGAKEHGTDEFAHVGNGSVPLAASLYVPRNDKLVKIDGNLIIHSVLASEKAMASRDDPVKKAGGETQLAVHGDLVPVVPLSGGRISHHHRNPSEPQRALGSPAKESLKSSANDGRLQEWFREGLEGPMLSSGMCTEVFQFDTSSAIVPVTPKRNASMEQRQNSTDLNKGKNRRILRGQPVTLVGSPYNISDEHAGSNSQKENFNKNNSLSSSMVVSVLVDPREVGDVDANGVSGPKSLSRIFVVVLIDSVKYVTYSCMLPFKGAVPHLVTT